MMRHEVVLHEYEKGGKRKVTVDGVTYNSKKEMYDTFHIRENLVYRLKKEFGLSPEEAIAEAIEYRIAQDKKTEEIRKKHEKEYLAAKEKAEERAQKSEFVFRNKVYKNFNKCCECYRQKFSISINRDSLKANAKRNHTSLQEELEKAIKRALKRKIRGNINYTKWCYVQVNTHEKVEKIKEMLGARFLFCTTAYKQNFKPVYIIHYKSKQKRTRKSSINK